MIADMIVNERLEISDAKMAIYRAAAAQRHAAQVAARGERLARAWRVAERAVRLLEVEFGATQVQIFGSLLQPALFHARSDVDLAAWGIDEQRYYRAVAELLGLDKEISFDLVRFEEASPTLQATILRHGVSL